MAKIRKIYDQTIKPDGTKTTIYPITSTRAVYTPEGATLDSYLKDGYFHGADLRGYKTVSNVTDLPTTENQFGWLIGEDLYVWVGTGGDTLEGLYQNCGHFRTPYVPDDEDLVADSNNELKLKDRTIEDGGMGYVILRKNKSFAEQVIYDNTTYEIRYDFDLNDESITLPEGCILNFVGGRLSNGRLIGNRSCFNTDVTYKIFDNVEFSGFDIPFIDIRWLGAVPDFDESSQTGTNNSPYLEEAITLAGKYYAGTGIRIVGRYMLSTAITTEYDVNIFGYHNNSRRLLVSQPDPSSPSLLFIGANITAITMVGQGEASKSSNISLHNLKVWGPSTSAFINYTCSGAPGRVSVIEECEFRSLGIVIKLTNSGRDTMLGNLTIDKCNVWYCSQFIVANSASTNRTFCNLIVQNSNIEQGSSKQFELQNVFGPIIITNNIIENLPNAIDITALHGDVYITNNYFELVTETAIKIVQGNANGIVDFSGNFFNEKIKINCGLATIANLDFVWVADGSAFSQCYFLKSCIRTNAFSLSWIRMACSFEDVSCFEGVRTGISGLGSLDTTVRQYVARQIGNSDYVVIATKQYDSMPENADYFAFVASGGTFSMGLGVDGSAIYNSVYTRPGYLTIYTQLPYSTGNNSLYIKGASADSAVTPVQILTTASKITDIKIATTDSIIPASSSYLPTFTKHTGYTIFDTTRGKLIVWNGTAWVNADGTAL